MDNTKKVQEVVKEVVKEEVKEKVVEVKEKVDVVKEEVKEVLKEVLKEEVKEVVKEVLKEEVKEVVKEVLKEEVKEVLKEEVKEVVKEVVKEEIKEEVTERVLSTESTELIDIRLSEVIKNPDKELIDLISQIILDNNKIEEIIKKSTILIKPEGLAKIMEVIKFLSTETSEGCTQLKQIIDAITKVLADGKLETYEIPELVSVVYTNIPNTNIKLTSYEVGVLLKLLILLLVESKVIKINELDYILVTKILDSSIKLLELNIKIPTNKICSCLF